MYQKISYALAVVLFGTLMTSCTTYSYTSRSAAIRGTTIDSRALGTEITADFSHQVTATSDRQTTLSAAKNQAVFLCLQQKGVEVVVDPVYQVEYRWFKKNPYTVTVMGFAGTYKQVPCGLDAFVEKNYSKEDIEKWLLLNDPKFVNLYYQKEKKDVHQQGGDVTNYYINSNGEVSSAKPRLKVAKVAAPTEQPTSSVMLKSSNALQQQKVNQLPDWKKSKKLRDAGIGLVVGGVVSAVAMGTPLIICSDNYRGVDRDAMIGSGIAFATLGGAMFVAGVPMLAVGQSRMNKVEKATLAFGGTSNGLGMRLTF